jgi:hypothetical protein
VNAFALTLTPSCRILLLGCCRSVVKPISIGLKAQANQKENVAFGQLQLRSGHFLDWHRNSRNAYRTPTPILLVDRPCGSSPRQWNPITCISGTSTFCNGLRRTLKRGVVKLSRASVQQKIPAVPFAATCWSLSRDSPKPIERVLCGEEKAPDEGSPGLSQSLGFHDETGRRKCLPSGPSPPFKRIEPQRKSPSIFAPGLRLPSL